MAKLNQLIRDLNLTVEEYYARLFASDDTDFVKMFEKKNITAYIFKSNTIDNIEDAYPSITDKSKNLFNQLKETFFYFLVLQQGEKYDIPNEVFDTVEEAVEYLKKNL